MARLSRDRLTTAGRSYFAALRLSFETWSLDMAKRSKISRGKSKRMFSKTASKTHRKNMPMPRKVPMRGGIRM